MKYHYEVHYTKSWWVPLYRWAVRRVCNVFPVSPLLLVIKAFVYARVVKEKHFKFLSGFIARWGFKFKAEK